MYNALAILCVSCKFSNPILALPRHLTIQFGDHEVALQLAVEIADLLSQPPTPQLSSTPYAQFSSAGVRLHLL